MGLRKLPSNIKFVFDREKFFEKLCSGKKVLHLGCADAIHLDEHLMYGTHLHVRLYRTTKDLYGVDLDENAIEKLRQKGIKNLFVGNVEKLDLDLPKPFDVVLAGELIEHLNCPGAFLESVKQYMDRETIFVLSTPNLLSLKLWLHAFLGTQRIHPDHSLGFTFSLLQTILERYGFKVEQWYTSVEQFNSLHNRIANMLLKPLFYMKPYLADTIISIAKLKDDSLE